MKQLTTVVNRRQRCGEGVRARGQQHLGQHGGADPLQMFHSQLTDIIEPQIRQDLPSGGTLEQEKKALMDISHTFKGLILSLHRFWCSFFFFTL